MSMLAEFILTYSQYSCMFSLGMSGVWDDHTGLTVVGTWQRQISKSDNTTTDESGLPQ